MDFFNEFDLSSDLNVGIVSHIHAIRCMLYLLLGLTKEEILKVAVPNSEPIVLEGDALGNFKLISHLKEEILTYVNKDI
jgi:bisphosphoglycerate-dependent phosphoglycerate mutase